MILPTDVPTRAEVDRLLEYRAPVSVTIYLPTDPASNGDQEHIELKTLAGQASSQLGEAEVGVRVIRELEELVGSWPSASATSPAGVLSLRSSATRCELSALLAIPSPPREHSNRRDKHQKRDQPRLGFRCLGTPWRRQYRVVARNQRFPSEQHRLPVPCPCRECARSHLRSTVAARRTRYIRESPNLTPGKYG